MRPDDIREWLYHIPFQPFRICLLEAAFFEIHHPEIVILKKSTMDLFFVGAHPRTPFHRGLLASGS